MNSNVLYLGISNNEIRSFLGMPKVKRALNVTHVDALSPCNHETLMFVSRLGLTLTDIDKGLNNIYLIDDSYPEYESEMNDFIRVSNPKYKFCKLVEEYDFTSNFQYEFDYDFERDNTYYKSEIYCDEIIIGDNFSVDDGAIVGGTDFSPVLADDGTLVQFPQLGGVKIGNDVIIKYNSMIGKGTFGFTEIGDNTMIDFGCQVGHNCIIGNSCIIAAGTIIGGSTTIGDHTVIGIGAKIRNSLKIGKNVSIGMGSVVIRDIPDNCVVVGNPAHIIEHKKIFNERGLV